MPEATQEEIEERYKDTILLFLDAQRNDLTEVNLLFDEVDSYTLVVCNTLRHWINAALMGQVPARSPEVESVIEQFSLTLNRLLDSVDNSVEYTTLSRAEIDAQVIVIMQIVVDLLPQMIQEDPSILYGLFGGDGLF